jgi:hypothetical protein
MTLTPDTQLGPYEIFVPIGRLEVRLQAKLAHSKGFAFL